MTQYCTNCGEPLAEDAQFCSSCGAKVSMPPHQRKTRKNTSARFPWPLIVGGALLVIAGVWWINSSSTPAAMPTAAIAIEQPTETTEIPYPSVTRADIADVKADLDAGSAIVVDVRGLTYYLEAHIPGAISMPTDDLEADYPSLPQDQMIYLYCT